MICYQFLQINSSKKDYHKSMDLEKNGQQIIRIKKL